MRPPFCEGCGQGVQRDAPPRSRCYRMAMGLTGTPIPPRNNSGPRTKRNSYHPVLASSSRLRSQDVSSSTPDEIHMQRQREKAEGFSRVVGLRRESPLHRRVVGADGHDLPCRSRTSGNRGRRRACGLMPLGVGGVRRPAASGSSHVLPPARPDEQDVALSDLHVSAPSRCSGDPPE